MILPDSSSLTFAQMADSVISGAGLGILTVLGGIGLWLVAQPLVDRLNRWIDKLVARIFGKSE